MTLTLSAPAHDDPYNHLHPDIRHLAGADDAVRVEAIYQDHWISYPAGEEAIDRLFEHLYMPRRHRMPSLLHWADPNSGKTAIHKEFQVRLRGSITRLEICCSS